MPLVYSYKPSRDCYVVSGQNYTDPSVNAIPNLYDDGVNGIKNVKEIANSAFRNLNNIQAAVIPSGIDYIGKGAFSGCASLKNIFILDSDLEIDNRAFENCTTLTGLFLGSGLRKLGDRSFGGCFTLHTLNLPNSLTGIGSGCFEFCLNLRGSNLTGLTDFLYLPINLKNLGKRSFANCRIEEVRIPSSDVKSIDQVFTNCTGLEYCIFNASGITGFGQNNNIDAGNFYSCNSLKTFKFPITFSGDISINFFAGAQKLQYVSIPSGVKRIEGLAFAHTSSLKRIDMPDNLEYIGELSFIYSRGGDNDLTTISDIFEITGAGTGINDPVATSVISKPFSLPTGLLQIGSMALAYMPLQTSFDLPQNLLLLGRPFLNNSNLININVHPNNPYNTGISGLLYNKAKSVLIFSPNYRSGVIDIPAGTITIDNSAFEGSSLTGVKIPSSLSSIGNYAFKDSTLLEINIPNNVNSIGTQAFDGCVYLKNISLPQNNIFQVLPSNFLRNAVSLEYLNLPNNIKFMPSGPPLTNCYSLKKIDLGTGFTPFFETSTQSVGDLLGQSLPNYVSPFYLGFPRDNLNFNHPGPFGPNHVYELTGVCINTGNPFLTDISGVVYTKNSGELIYYPPGRISMDNYTVNGNIYSPPDHVTGIRAAAFQNSNLLGRVYIKNNIRFVGDQFNSYTFKNCSNLREITFSDCRISSFVLYNNPLLTGIIFESTGRCALPGLSFRNVGVSNFFIPSGLSGVNTSTFIDSNNLSGITVDPAHPLLSSVDGILYNKPQNQIIIFPPNLQGNIFLPDGVTGINPLAFVDSKISSIKMGTGIKSIAGTVFANCEFLTGIRFGDSITELRGSIASNCGALKEVYFGKSMKYFNFSGNSSVVSTFSNTPSIKSIVYPTGDFIINYSTFQSSGKFLETMRTPNYLVFGQNGYNGVFINGAGLYLAEPNFQKITRYSINENNETTINYIDVNYNKSGLYYNAINQEMIIPETFENRKVILLSGASQEVGVFSKDDIYLKRIVIPSGIKIVDNINISFGVSGLRSLTGISVSNDNPYVSSVKGILYNKNKNQIIAAPRECEQNYLCLEDTFQSISSEAFAYNENISGINFKGNAPQIGQDVFTGANPNLKIYRKKYSVDGWSDYLQDRKTYFKSNNLILTNGPNNKFNIFTGENGEMRTSYSC